MEKDILEWCATLLIVVTPIVSCIGFYVTNKTKTKIDIENLRELVNNMDEDVDLKVDKTECETISGRLEKGLKELSLTTQSINDTVIRMETTMNFYIKKNNRIM